MQRGEALVPKCGRTCLSVLVLWPGVMDRNWVVQRLMEGAVRLCAGEHGTGAGQEVSEATVRAEGFPPYVWILTPWCTGLDCSTWRVFVAGMPVPVVRCSAGGPSLNLVEWTVPEIVLVPGTVGGLG
jgi:hypothetical protein